MSKHIPICKINFLYNEKLEFAPTFTVELATLTFPLF